MSRREPENTDPTINIDNIHNVNIACKQLLPTPSAVEARLPLRRKAAATVLRGRRTVESILDRHDPRLLVIVGPCSIHDLDAGREYALRLRTLADELGDTIFVVMRVYFEKPRTAVGWKGFVNDPYLDGSFQVAEGLLLARGFLLELAEAGMPVATEALDPITPQYLGDLVSWSAVGARTTESQTHREMASGLSTPVGFKNGTDGSLKIAVDAVCSATRPHAFLGINEQGRCAVFHTRGNRHAHIILRGGRRPNYSPANVARCEQQLLAAGLPANVVVDCSHGNSRREPRLQAAVLESCVRQIRKGNRSLVGVMLESNLEWGSQRLLPGGAGRLRRGVSITDPCIDWKTTELILRAASQRLRPALARRAVAQGDGESSSQASRVSRGWSPLPSSRRQRCAGSRASPAGRPAAARSARPPPSR